MWKIITKNLWIKIFCLLAAAGLWLYIASGQNSVGKFPGSITVRAINVPAGLVATYDIKTVNIKVMGDSSVWRKLSSDTFSAYVDLSAHSEGTYELPVNVVSSVQGVQIVEKDPEKIFVSLEPVISKKVNVNKKIEGSAGEGLVAGNIDLDPTEVDAKGPKSLIDKLTEATATINLNGETDNFTKTVSVVAYDENGDPENNIEFVPAEVKASVSIVKASNNKTVGIKVLTSGSPKSGYFVSDISTTPATVDITGPADILVKTSYAETFSVDIGGASLDMEKSVSLNLKDGIALQAGTTPKILVKIKFSRADISKEMTANITAKNLDSSYYLSSVNPIQINVTCSGPADLIANLKNSDVNLALDFADKRILSGAVYNFELSAKNFSVPDGVSVSSIVPSSVSVAVDKKH